MANVSKSDFWNEKYSEGITPWDINQAAPAFIRYFNDIKNTPKNKVLVPGCGRGHDAFHIAEAGFEVHGIDFAENAIDFCTKKKGKLNLNNIYFYSLDFFNLIKNKKWESSFDYVVEHTFFCAIDPEKRKDYFNTINFLIKPKGKYVGLFFVRESDSGPPFGTSPDEIRNLVKNEYSEVFKLKELSKSEKFKDGYHYFGVFEKN